MLVNPLARITVAVILLFVLLCAAPGALATPAALRPAALAGADRYVSLVDPARTGELSAVLRPPNPYDDHPGPDHVGAPVEIKRVADIDLTTAAGWRAAAALGTAEILGLPEDHFTDHRSATSDGSGEVRFTGLPLGLWVADSPDGRFEPFVVTLPRTAADGTYWVYSVTAYAKPDANATGPTTDPTRTPTWPPTDPDADPTDTRAPAGPTDGHGAESTRSDQPTAAVPQPANTEQTQPAQWAQEPGPPTSDAQVRKAQDRDGGLASTGAAVGGLVVAAAVLIAAGLLLLSRRRRGPDET